MRLAVLQQRALRLADSLPSAQRVLLSDGDVIIRESYQQRRSFKPRGIWYSFGGEWLRWVADNAPKWLQRYRNVYYVGVRTDKLISLRTSSDFRAFDRRFGASSDDAESNEVDLVDWSAVSAEHAGIEVRDWPTNSAWFTGWDVLSGVVWDLSAIRRIELVHSL